MCKWCFDNFIWRNHYRAFAKRIEIFYTNDMKLNYVLPILNLLYKKISYLISISWAILILYWAALSIAVPHLTGVCNVQATDRRRRYGSDGAQPCAQHRKRGYTVSIFNRSREKTEEVIAENPGKKLVPYYTVQRVRWIPRNTTS